MIAYEVTIEVQAHIRAEYRRWLSTHVGEMIALPGFVGAEIFERIEPRPENDAQAFVVVFRLVDEAALARYLAEHAPRLRQEGVELFGAAMSASRRVLRPSPGP